MLLWLRSQFDEPLSSRAEDEPQVLVMKASLGGETEVDKL
jgi:hypothetical protein